MFQDNEITFEDWQGILIASLEVGGNYKPLLQKVNIWLKSLRKNQPLSPPLNEISLPYFIEITLPKLISQILCFGYIMNYDEGKLINQFLRRVIKSISSIQQYINTDVIKAIAQIFNSNQKLYTSNLMHDWFQNVTKCYYDQIDMLTAVMDSMIVDNFKGFINFYILNISILTASLKNKKNTQSSSLSTQFFDLSNHYIQVFKEFIKSRFEDPKFFSKNFEILSNAFDSLSNFLLVSELDDKKYIRPLYQFLYSNISYPQIEIQKFFAHCISTLCRNPKQARIVLSEQNEESNSFFDNLISSDIQPDTLKELQPFIQLQIEQGTINLKSLLNFWYICSSSQVLNNNKACIDIFAYTLKFLDSDSIREFLSAIQINFTEFYFNVLAKTIFNLQNLERTLDIAISCIRILLSLTIVDDYAKKTLFDLIDLKLNNDILQALLEETIPLFENENNVDLACQIFEKAISTSSDPSHLFNENLNFDKILKMMNDQNRSQLIIVLFHYHLKIGSKPSSDLIKELLDSNSHDETWDFLRKLLKNKNYQSLEDLKELYLIAKDENPISATHSYYKFLKTLVFKISNKSFIETNGIMPVSNIHIPFKIKCQSIQGLDLILQIYQFNMNPKTVASAKKFLLIIFKSWDPNLSVNYLNEQIQQLILVKPDQSSLTSVEENESLIRSLQLVYDYIIEFEVNTDPEDFNAPRHSYPKNFIVIIINISTIYNNNHYFIHFDQQKTLKNLKERIAERENRSLSSITLENYQQNQESLSLFECGITTNSQINVKFSSFDITQKRQTFSPSYLFYDGQFGDVLFNLLDDNEKLNNNIWRILQILPTTKSVTNIFNIQNQEEKNIEDEITENFLSHLLKLDNKYKKLYLIQALAKSDINIFVHSDLLTIIFGLFNDQFYKDDLIYLFNSRYNNENFPEAQDFLITLIQYIPEANNDDIITTIFQLTNNIAKENDFNMLKECLNIFEKLNHTFWRQIMDFVLEVIKRKDYGYDLVDFCQSRIIYEEGNFQFALDLLSNIIKFIDIAQAVLLYNNLIERVIKYVYDVDKFQHNPEELRMFSDITNCIVPIIDQFPSLIEATELPISTLFEITFGKHYNLIQKSVFKIISTYLKYKKDNETTNKIVAQLKKMINFPLERWNYNPKNFERTAPYTGLRNLGATCFLNSIFQQLFHLFPIRYFLSTFEFKDDNAIKTLQTLFIQMAFTIRSFSDTSKFIETWKGWNNSLLNPKVQQDAVEFFLALIDTLPSKISDMFKGETKNFLSGISYKFNNSSTETFYNLNIPIKNHINIESSFDEFIQDEQLSDYEIDDTNKQKISVRKYLRISKLPSVLVIQLTRFEYRNNDRYKINDRFEFPLCLNIKKLCEDQTDSDENQFIYNLNGIIIHTGVASGGHYISNIRKGTDWWSFNDIEVTQINEKDVLNNAYGGKEGNSSAYVLFYTKNDYFSFEKSKDGEVNHRISFDDEFDYSNEITGLNEVLEDNEIFEKSQALFGASVIDFIQGISEPLLNLSFYIRVICHSKNYQKASQFITDLKEMIELDLNKSSALNKCADYLNNNISDVVDDYINCSHDTFIFNLSEIILFIFTSLDKITSDNKEDSTIVKSNEKSMNFFKNFAQNVIMHSNSYRQLPAMLNIIKNYIQNYIFDAFQNGWIQILILILDSVYSSQVSRNQTILSNLNLSSLFILLNAILSKVPKIDFDLSAGLLKHASDIKLSEANKNSYTELLMTCTVNHNLSILKIKGIIPVNNDQIKNKIFNNLKQIIIDPIPEIQYELHQKEKEEEKQTTQAVYVTIKSNNESGIKEQETKDQEIKEQKSKEQDTKSIEIDFINQTINDLIKKETFTESELCQLFQKEIKNKNNDLIKKIIAYSPQLFAQKLLNSSVSKIYTNLYKALFEQVEKGNDSEAYMPILLISFDAYLENIIFDNEEIVKYIPKSFINTMDSFPLCNYIELLKYLITQQKDYTTERVDIIIKMIKRLDNTKRIFPDYTIRSLMLVLTSFPRESFKGILQDILEYFIIRISDAKIDQVSKEIDPILTIINKLLLIENQSPKTLEIDQNDELFNEVLENFKNQSLQTFSIQYLTNTLNCSQTPTLYGNTSNYTLTESSKKLFKIYLLLGEKVPEMKEICHSMGLEVMKVFESKKVLIETKIKFFNFYYEFISEIIDNSLITDLFNEFINIINKKGIPIQRNDIDNFRKFIEIISTIDFECEFNDIDVDFDFFVNLSLISQIGSRELTKKILKWLYYHSSFVHDNIVRILTDLITQKSFSQQDYFYDMAFQYCMQTKNAELLTKIYNLAKDKLSKGKAYSIILRLVNNKFGNDLFKFNFIKSDQVNDKTNKDEEKNEQNEKSKETNENKNDEQNDKNFEWIVPFLQSNWSSFDKNYEEIQAHTFFVKNMSDEIRLKLLMEAEDRYFFTGTIEGKNKISNVLLSYIPLCKDIIPQYKEKTKFRKEMMQDSKFSQSEKFYLIPFLKILFKD